MLGFMWKKIERIVRAVASFIMIENVLPRNFNLITMQILDLNLNYRFD